MTTSISAIAASIVYSPVMTRDPDSRFVIVLHNRRYLLIASNGNDGYAAWTLDVFDHEWRSYLDKRIIEFEKLAERDKSRDVSRDVLSMLSSTDWHTGKAKHRERVGLDYLSLPWTKELREAMHPDIAALHALNFARYIGKEEESPSAPVMTAEALVYAPVVVS